MIILSSVIGNFLPRVPLPLIQVILGTFAAIFTIIFLPEISSLFGITSTKEFIVKPELFFAFFIAPILYREAEEADILEINSLRKEVVFMAFAVVFITCLGVGYIFHLLFPDTPLPACFAFGAILGPIDAVAVFAFTKNMHIKSAILSILKGEGLINDASGIVAFQFSIAALITGGFSILIAGLDLLIVSIGGLIIGIILGLLKAYLHKFFKLIHEKNALIYIISEIAMPFIAYIVAEYFHTSGIISAVAAGAVSSFRTDTPSLLNAKVNEVRRTVWRMFSYLLNGMIFILLGLELPDIMINLFKQYRIDDIRIFIAPIIITAVLLLLRFLSVYIFASQTFSETKKEKFWTSAFLTISGPKGAVSLAIAFSIPVTILGKDFLERPLLLFETAMCIMLTLVVTAIFLPILAKEDINLGKHKNRITIHLLQMVIRKLNKNFEYKNIMVAVLHYKKRIEEIEKNVKRKRILKELRILRKIYWKEAKIIYKNKIKDNALEKNEYKILDKISKIQKEYSRHKAISILSSRVKKKVHFDTWLLTEKEKKMVSKEKLISIFFELNAEIFSVIEEKYPHISYSALEKLFDQKIDMAGQVFGAFFDEKLYENFRDIWVLQMLTAFDVDRKLVEEYLCKDKIDFNTADKMRVIINDIEKYTIEERDNTSLYRLIGSRIRKRMHKLKKKKNRIKYYKK
jgi:CPA1 family monovalent cation:H+ antiporter